MQNYIYANSYTAVGNTWSCNVALPNNTLKFDSNKLKHILAEAALLGDSELPVGSPDNKKWRKRDALEKLLKTDSTSEKKRG